MVYIIGFFLVMIAAFVIMVFMAMAYHFFYGFTPVMAALMIVLGLVVGLWNAVKNTVTVFREVYGKEVEDYE